MFCPGYILELSKDLLATITGLVKIGRFASEEDQKTVGKQILSKSASSLDHVKDPAKHKLKGVQTEGPNGPQSVGATTGTGTKEPTGSGSTELEARLR